MYEVSTNKGSACSFTKENFCNGVGVLYYGHQHLVVQDPRCEPVVICSEE